jgi:hypothetical protein
MIARIETGRGKLQQCRNHLQEVSELAYAKCMDNIEYTGQGIFSASLLRAAVHSFTTNSVP